MTTNLNVKTILEEVASDKVTLICGKHNYVAAKKRANGVVAIPPRPNGCKLCWESYYITDLALTPPAKRQERLDELEEVIRHAVEYERTGKFGRDFELFEPSDERFRVGYEQDAADDETGEDRIAVPGEEKLS